MKYVNHMSILFFIQFIVFMSGCKIVEWGKENFKQTERYDKELTKHMKPFLKSAVVYDQMATIADFDAIFLTDKARMFYVDYFKQKHVISQEKESVMRQRLLNENKYYISFYVLGSQVENLYPSNRSLFTGEYYKQQPLLGEKDAEWQVRLQVGDQEYAPDSIRIVELPIEWQHFFGSRYSQFKSVYLIKFDAVDSFDKEVLPSGAHHTLSLLFVSARYKAKLEWKEIIYNEK